jgi:FdhD protein
MHRRIIRPGSYDHQPPMTDNQSHPGAARRALTGAEDDLLAREEPLQISVGQQRVLTMRTPGDDLALATGFLLSEGVIDDATDITGHVFELGDPAALQPDTIHLHLRGGKQDRVVGRLTRTHEIRTSCGICGLTDPDALLEDTRPLLSGTPRLARDQIDGLRTDFESRQALFRLTGACHGAALYDPGGGLLGLGEDIGRHNALDKAIGQASAAGHDLRQAVALLSGRAGYDLTMKCLRVGVPIILSVSAASALSFDLCVTAGGTLCGFLRPGRLKIYCDSGRITG